MKRNNAELVVGGVIFTSLFILIAGVIWLKEVSISRKVVEYTALFPSIGTLQLGNPVTVNGVKMGQVNKIALRGDSVSVTFGLDKSVVFTDSSTVTVQNIGLMGERKVEIKLSLKGTAHVPDTKGHITYIHGKFDSGIAEAMGMLGTVLGEVTNLVDTVQGVVNHTVADTGFVHLFKNVTQRLDSVVYLADAIIRENRGGINGTVTDLRATSKSLRELLEQNKANFNRISENGGKISDEAVVLIARADSIAVTLNSMLDSIDAGRGSVGILMKDSTIVPNLKQSVADLDTLLRGVNDDGLKLRVKLGFGRHHIKKKTGVAQ